MISLGEAKQFIEDLLIIQCDGLGKQQVLEAFEEIDKTGDNEVDIEEMLEFLKIININVFNSELNMDILSKKMKWEGEV